MHVHSIAFNGVIENISMRGGNDELKKHPEYGLFLKIGVLCNNSTSEIRDNKVKSTGDPEEVALLRMANDLEESITEMELY